MSGRAGALGQATAALARAGSAVIVSHTVPDGDAVGSSFGLALALEQRGCRVVVCGEGAVPPAFRFLPGQHLYRAWPGGLEADVAVYLDCTDQERAGGVRPQAAVTINIDHHLGNTGFGHVNVVDETAAAAGELVYDLLSAMGSRPGADVATCLLVAIVSDTGHFTHENTSPASLRAAAALVEAGARPSAIAFELQGQRRLAAVRLLGLALNTLELAGGGRMAVMELDQAAFAASAARPEDADGIINHGISLAGVEVAVLFKESEPGTVRVSFRSRGGVDVQALAASLGGGGHARAAGCELRAPIKAARALVEAALRERLCPRP